MSNESLVKKEPAPDDLENSHSFQMSCSGNKAKGVTEKPFAKETRCVIHGSNQPSQQKSGIEMGLSRMDLCRMLVVNGVNPFDIYRRLTRFLRALH